MKQDRFLTGILIGIAVMVILALVVFFIRRDNLVYVTDDTPEGVIQNYVVALQKKDFDKAYGYLAELPNKPTIDQFKQAFMNHSVDPTNTGVEIGKVEVNTESASVTLNILYGPGDPFSSGYRNTDYGLLVKESGKWKIKQMPNNFWAYDWFQPNTVPAQPVK